MKANRSANLRKDDDRAEIGIGTLIVFIAAVLVAAVAAAVLINTSGKLQQRSEETGAAATRDVSSNFYLLGVWASRPGTTGDMENVNVTIGTGAASELIDLSNTTIVVQSGSTLMTLDYADVAPAAGTFNGTKIRDADGSYTGMTPVLSGGDLVTIWIDMSSNSITLGPGEKLNIRLLPPVGAPLISDITMPPTFGVDTVVQVR